MDLYDDLDTKRAGQIEGWSSGIKMLQTQLAIKKATVVPPKREPPKKPLLSLAPIVSLRPKKPAAEDETKIRKDLLTAKQHQITIAQPLPPTTEKPIDYDWNIVDEYDPLWPNEYEKLVKEKREKDTKDRNDDHHHQRSNSNNNNNNSSHRKRRGGNSRYNNDDSSSSPVSKFSGFGGRIGDEDSYSKSPPTTGSQSRTGGAAIAPPPSLQEPSNQNDNSTSSTVTIPYGAGSVAAKIMAKYGFKDGQGLGKQEQGMSMALQVEKTSKRGGRIIHEKELLMAPPPITSSPPHLQPPPLPTAVLTTTVTTTNQVTSPPADTTNKTEPSITEIMKSPSKVILLRNMVGPGDVDEELEPEVKDECNTKYGDVISVVIKEVQGTAPEEAVRIFVEFKRIESAIKAVVDLNGRFFGGRQVRAGFYDYDKFKISKIYD